MPSATATNPGQDMVERAIEFMAARTDLGHGLAEFVATLEVSRAHFARIFKRATGSPPHHYFVEQRVRRARELLSGAVSPKLAQIAFSLGFSDQAHFTRQFKRAVGLTPGEFVRTSQAAEAPAGTSAA
jgi:transcriptional regulator GlxA family with amidase domain